MFKYVPKVDLAAALDALDKAHALVLNVRAVFIAAGEVDGAARMLETASRIADEIAAIEKALGAAKP